MNWGEELFYRFKIIGKDMKKLNNNFTKENFAFVKGVLSDLDLVSNENIMILGHFFTRFIIEEFDFVFKIENLKEDVSTPSYVMIKPEYWASLTASVFNSIF